MLIFWALAAPVAAIIGFPASFIMGDVRVLYRLFMWGAWCGVWITGVSVETIGLDEFDHSRSYIFMTNHVSNLDPPIQIPLIPRRTSVMVKKEFFKFPDPRPLHAHGIAGARGSRQSRRRHRSRACRQGRRSSKE